MDNRRNTIPYSYVMSGFNGFLRRGFGSTSATTLREAASSFQKVNNQMINFDQQQTSGSLGDIIQVGDIDIDGKNRRISIYDDGRVNEVGRLGNLDG